MSVAIKLGDHRNGLIQMGEIVSLHQCLHLTEELQQLASQRQVEAEADLVSEHAGGGLRVHQIVAVIRVALSCLLESAATPGGTWLEDVLVAVLVQNLHQAAWRAPVNPAAVVLEGGHHGELVKGQLHSAAGGGGGGDSPDLDGVAVEKDLEHGEGLFGAEGAEDVVHPIVAICTGS